jgi:hypothetical protein
VAAALLASTQLAAAGDLESLGCHLVCFHLWHVDSLSLLFTQSHRLGLTLPLLVFGVLTDHVYPALTLYDLAFRATTFDRWRYFQIYHLPTRTALQAS